MRHLKNRINLFSNFPKKRYNFALDVTAGSSLLWTIGGCKSDGVNTGGENTGGENTGGDSTDGDNTGGDSTDGDSTDGDNTGGDSTDGDSTEDNELLGLRALSSVLEMPMATKDAALFLKQGSRHGETELQYGFFDTTQEKLILNQSDENRYRMSGDAESIKGQDWLIARFEKAFRSIESVTQLKFEEPENPDIDNIDIAYFIKDYNSGILGYSRYPPRGYGILDKDLADERFDYDASPLQELIVHELGHGLGLRHPFKGSSYGSRNDRELEGLEATTAFTVEAYIDMRHATYFDGEKEVVRYLDSLGLYDVYALQALYGKNENYNAGDTFYGADYFKDHWIPKVLWDGGGDDTIDASTVTFDYLQEYATNSEKTLPTPRHEIDLRQGHFSSIGIIEEGFLPKDSLFRGYHNLSIAFDAEIENAIGGAGADVLIGNSLSNSLSGGLGEDVLYSLSGDDTLYGGRGDDQLHGGHGKDTAVFQGLSRDYKVFDTGESYMIYGEDGADVLYSIEYLHFIGDETTKAIDADIAQKEDLESLPYASLGKNSTLHASFESQEDIDWVRIRTSVYGDISKTATVFKASLEGLGKIEGVYNGIDGEKHTFSVDRMDIKPTEDYYLKIEGTDVGAYTLTIEEVPAQPDLLLEIDLIAGDTAYARSYLYYNVKITNAGEVAAKANYIKFYISTDDKFDGATDEPIASDHYAGISAFSPLSANYERSWYGGVSIPDYFASGSYYLIARIDPDHVIDESNENNNMQIHKFEVEQRDTDRDLGIIADQEQRIVGGIRGDDTDTYTFTLEKPSYVGLFLDRVIVNISSLKISLTKKGDQESIMAQDYPYNGLYGEGPLAAGDYTLTLSTNNGYRSGYALHVYAFGEDESMRKDDYAEDATTTGVLGVETSLRGFLHHHSDIDWFKLELEAGKTYDFEHVRARLWLWQSFRSKNLWHCGCSGFDRKWRKEL